MSKPLIPTCSFRWFIRHREFAGDGDTTFTCDRVLQQMFTKPNGDQVWCDVPEVVEHCYD